MSALADNDAIGPPSSWVRRSVPPEAQPRPRVWVVDDNALQAEMARQALAEHCDTSVYASGPMAIEQLALGSLPPDVLVLDWNMPEMSGADVCSFVRATYDTARLPILVLTATAAHEAVLAALEAGANDFVRVPFTDAELNARVATLARTKFLHTKLLAAEQVMRIEAEFRERFIGMLAHDLRQPLNTLSMASMLRHAEPAAVAKLSDIERRAVQRMKRMIGELLDFTRNRPETGMPLERKRMDFAELVATTLDEIRVAHPEAKLELVVDGPCVGNWDADRLTQVCSNLIGNAIEHSVSNMPVSVVLQGAEADVILRITNRGPPIPESVRATLFEPFRRGSGRRTRGGVGLGLHIVSQIVGVHAGEVWATSDDHGTHFNVRLPKG